MPKVPKDEVKSKPITDFFPRKSTSSQSTALSASRSVGSPKSARRLSTTKENANANAAHSPIPPAQAEYCLLADVSLPTTLATITSPMQPSTKRIRSQSVTSPKARKNVKRSKNILRDSKFEENMDIDADESVVYVRSANGMKTDTVLAQAGRTIMGQMKQSPLPEPPNIELETRSLVASSQPEERELVEEKPKPRYPTFGIDTVDHWRNQPLLSPVTDSSPVEHTHTDMGQSNDEASFAGTAVLGSSTASTPSRTPSLLTSIPTPPPTDGLSNLDTQSIAQPLDPAARTAHIIAEIKARAYAAARSNSGSMSPLSAIGSLDSSDDEDGFGLLGLKDNKLACPAKLTKASPGKPARYNLRRTSGPTSVINQPEWKPKLRNISPSPPLATQRKASVNPIDLLLKEKRTSEKREPNSKDIRIIGLASLDLDDDYSDVDYDSGGDISKEYKPKGKTPITIDDDENPFIDENQKKQVLGIFIGDKAIQAENANLQMRQSVGVALWDSAIPYSMDTVDSPQLCKVDYEGRDPILKAFSEAVTNGDPILIKLVLQMSALEIASYADGGEKVTNYLSDLAFSCAEDELGQAAFNALCCLWSSPSTSASPITFDSVLTALCRLGAKKTILVEQGWTIVDEPRSTINESRRATLVDRLVCCLAKAAKYKSIYPKEIPDHTTALLLISLDPSTSHELRLRISQTIHEIWQLLDGETQLATDLETTIVNKVLRLVQLYTSQNKAYALSFLAFGSGRTARIARVIAHSMLHDISALLPSQYSPLPPLSGILAMLSSSTQGTGQPPGKFEICESTNYVDMSAWTSVLSVALNDVPAYMDTEEFSTTLPSSYSSPGKERSQSPIVALYHKLYSIHNRIHDTRAAHLDRSRTKALLFQTAFRVLYQHDTICRYRKTNRNLQHYFHPKK